MPSRAFAAQVYAGYYLTEDPALATDIAFDFEDGQRVAFIGVPDGINILTDLEEYDPPDLSDGIAATAVAYSEENGLGFSLALPVPVFDLMNTVVGERLMGSSIIRSYGEAVAVRLLFGATIPVELMVSAEDLLVQVPSPAERPPPSGQLYPGTEVDATEFSFLLGRELAAIHRRLVTDAQAGGVCVDRVILEWSDGLCSELYWGENGECDCREVPPAHHLLLDDPTRHRLDSPPILAPLRGRSLTRVWKFTDSNSLGLWFGDVSIAFVAAHAGISIQPSPWVELSELRY